MENLMEVRRSLTAVGENGDRVEAELVYSPDEPLAVRLLFRNEDEVVPWTFARDLLIEGMSRLAGTGDVLIQPVPSIRSRRMIAIGLTGHMIDTGAPETAIFALERKTVQDFLDETQALVPVGDEVSEDAIELELRELLDGGELL